MIQKLTVPIIVIVALLAGFVVYNNFIKKDVPDGIVASSVEATSSLDEDILPILLKLNDITFDGSIFSDPVFKTLEDQSKQVEPEEGGRVNPFAPASAVSGSGTNSVIGPTFGTQ